MSEQGFFDNLNSKTSFWLGVGGGLGVMFAVGFFVLLGLYTSGNAGTFTKTTTTTGTQPTAAAPTTGTQPTAAAPAPTVNAAALEVQADDHIQGPADAKITFIEFSDIQCPFCQRFHPTVQQILAEYPNDVRWVYKHFPLDSIHPMARSAAEASECLAEQLGDGGFFTYLDNLFAQQQLLGRELYISEAAKLGANQSEFTSCLDSGKYKQLVEDDYQQGIAAGVRGTPSSYVNGRNISGALPYEQVKAVIDSLLNS